MCVSHQPRADRSKQAAFQYSTPVCTDGNEVCVAGPVDESGNSRREKQFRVDLYPLTVSDGVLGDLAGVRKRVAPLFLLPALQLLQQRGLRPSWCSRIL